MCTPYNSSCLSITPHWITTGKSSDLVFDMSTDEGVKRNSIDLEEHQYIQLKASKKALETGKNEFDFYASIYAEMIT